MVNMCRKLICETVLMELQDLKEWLFLKDKFQIVRTKALGSHPDSYFRLNKLLSFDYQN